MTDKNILEQLAKSIWENLDVSEKYTTVEREIFNYFDEIGAKYGKRNAVNMLIAELEKYYFNN